MHVSVSAGLKLVEEKPFMTSFDCALPQSTNKNSIIKILLKGALTCNTLKRFGRFWNQKTLEIQLNHRTKKPQPQTNLKTNELSLFRVLME